MVRSIASIFVGAVAWLAGFYLLVFLLALAWPDYAVHARTWQMERVFNFTAVMACFTFSFWALADVGAGWVVKKVSNHRVAVWVFAGLLQIYVAALHLVLIWSSFPWWYNLGVVIPVIPAVLLGAKLADGPHSSTETAAA